MKREAHGRDSGFPLKDLYDKTIGLDLLREIGLTVLEVDDRTGSAKVQLPDAWQVVPDSGNSFNIIDRYGHWRAYVSPAYADEPGFTTLMHRYWPMFDSSRGWESPVTYQVFDFGVMPFGTPDNEWPTVHTVEHEFWGDGERTGNYREMDDLAIQEVLAWTNEHLPQWENPTAYWQS